MISVGIDIGGTGSRIRAVGADGSVPYAAAGEATRITAGGSAVPETALALLRAFADDRPDLAAEVDGVALGATGLATLVADPLALAVALGSMPRARPATVVAIDAVTAHRGALGGAAGAVIALGTGAVALGTDHRTVWRRVDGWGHLLGDRGAGAWLGMRGLDAAVRAYDGRDAAGTALLECARARFGDVTTWPSQLYTRDDRAGVLAGFARDVIDVADTGDATAQELVSEAASEAAASAVAALGADLPRVVAATGGLLASERYASAFTAALADADVAVHEALGDPLDGALSLARAAASGDVVTSAGFVWG